jgi:bacterioferritin-associated ferredoxin
MMSDPGGKGPVVYCRCEEIDEEEIRNAWDAGYRTPEELKRLLRIGMGPCQGRTCTPLLLGLLARLSGRPVAEVAPPFGRPPLKPTPLRMFADLAKREDRGGEMPGGGERA